MDQGFLKRVYRIIDDADVVLEIVDARFPELTRNRELERRVLNKKKGLIIVFNKSDLVGKKGIDRHKKSVKGRTVFVSARERTGTRKLREAIGRSSNKKEVVIAVIGFPNTGKSSLINTLKGKHVSKVSSKAGFTRGEQMIRVNDRIMLIDSPGIIPYKERDPYKLILVGAKNPQDLPDVELGGITLIRHLQKEFPEKMEELVGKKHAQDDAEDILEILAHKWNKVIKGNVANTHDTAQVVLKKWSMGSL